MPALREEFTVRVLPHVDAAFRLARVLCGDAAEAEDVVQEAVLRAYRAFAGLRGADARPWLLAIVRNAFLTQHARARRRPTVPLPDDAHDDEAFADPAPGPEEQASRRDDGRQLAALLERLAPEHREILLLREVEELSYRDIAQVTGLAAGTVMSRLHRARAALQAIWPRADRDEETHR